MTAPTTFDKSNPWSFVWVSLLAYVVIGYFLFFAGSLLRMPDVFKDWIAYFATSIKSLDTAEKIAQLGGNDPSAIQVLILYTAFGSIVLTIWCLQTWL
jgi:hypothetical protein